MSKAHDKAYQQVKTYKSFGTHISSDDDDDDKERNIYNKDEANALFSINEYLQKENCTIFYIGTLPVMQKCYICNICNPQEDKYICEYCYINCHNICRKLKKEKCENINNEKDYKGIKEFYCICGREYKHNPPYPLINEHGPCDLIRLDQVLKLNNFYCENHKLRICCICSVKCHNKCKIVTKNKEEHQKLNRRKRDICMCINECHTSYNEVAFQFPLDEYQKLSGIHIWPIQILNILFYSKRTFHKLSNLFISVLNKEKTTEKDEKKFISLLKLFSNTFNRKFKTFYYNDDILDIFNYQNLINYIHDIKLNNSTNVILKFRLIFILLFVHLRKDFQNIKCITSIDFLCSSPLERIKFKIILGKQTIYNENIYNKYNNNKIMEENNILKYIALEDICRLMEISIKYINLDKIAYEFEVGLKYICFILKKMLFTKIELIKLVHHLFIFFNKFYDYIKSKNPKIELLLNIFQGIAEIIFMISITYNDYAVMEYLYKYKNTISIEDIKSIDDFIHIKSLCGSALFQIILKSCDIIRNYYERLPKRGDKINKDNDIIKNNRLFPEKIISLFTESLGIFCLADSIYYKQICSITKNELINFYQFIDKFENNLYFNFNNKNELERLLFDLKNNIENIFNQFFTSSKDQKASEINTKIYQNIKVFSDNINNLMSNLNIRNSINSNVQNEDYGTYSNLRRTSINFTMLNNQDNNSSVKILSQIKEQISDIASNENEIDNIKKDNNLNNYLRKLSLKNIHYKFLNNIINNNFIKEEFVDMLIISNIDENISKILSFLTNSNYPNYLTIELCDIIYSTLRLYLYSKNGIEYFLMGKNLSRINKIFNRFNYNNKNNKPELGKNIQFNLKIMDKTIDFLLDVTKGIKIYGLSIKYNKVLSRFKKKLLEHIYIFNIVANNNLVEFSINFKRILKIFINLKDDFKYEDFEDIKKQCILIFEKNPLFNKNTFFKILYSLQSKQNYNINNNNNNNEKIFLSLYFTFFKFITINTFYFYNNEETNKLLNILFNFIDINKIKSAFLNNIFTIKQKYILLEYLRTIYFSDYLDEYEILKQVTSLTNSEFEILIRNNLINTHINPDDFRYKNNNNLNNISQNFLMNKYSKIKDIEIILEIYSNEIKKFPEQLNNCDLKHCDIFYKQILLDIKYISIFFYCQKNNLFGKFKILFYGLTLDFLTKIDSFYKIYQKIKRNHKENNKKIILEEEDIINNIDNNWNNEMEKINKKINNMKSISFNIYNKKLIYVYLTESLDILIKLCKINTKYNLQNYLEYYDVMAESNFTPFSLLETLDYEYFYDEKTEESNIIVKNEPNLFKIENLKTSFINSFIDINNTNFLEVITNDSGENYFLDFRKKYIDYFLSFLNSNESNDLRKLEINLCILTKMMFYDSDGMQSKFSNIKNNEFFINLNLDINKYSVLVFSLSKNIFAYNIAGEITNLNKLYIQFIQALGEGFNFTFHDNIFHVPKIDNNENNKINNKIIEKFEERKNEELYGKTTIIGNCDNNQKRIMILKKTLYISIINNLKYALYKLDLENLIDSELPYDKLIIFISNAIDFIIEYISSTKENNNIIKLCFKKLFLGVKIKALSSNYKNDEALIIKNNPYLKLFFTEIKKEYLNNNFAIQRKKIICYTKIKLTQMLIYYLLTGGKEAFVKKLNEKDFTTINLYSEILYNFNDLLNHLSIKNPELISKLNLEETIEGYTNKLIEFYTYEENFRNMIELQLIFDAFILIKILEDIYKDNRLNVLFQKNDDILDKNTIDGNGEFNLSSKFSKSIYKFLNIIILKVEIKMDEKEDEENNEYDDDESEDIETEEIFTDKNKYNETIAKKIKNRLKKDVTFNNLINNYKKHCRKTNVYQEDKKDGDNKNNEEEIEESFSCSYSNNEEISSDDEDSNENSNVKTIFFPRPFLTFFLSKSTQNKFLNEVDRTSVHSKFDSLLKYADYCLFEMVINKHLIGNHKINKFFVNLNYTYIEMINYLFIIIQNFLILFRFFKKTDESYQEYNTFDTNKIRKLHIENLILAILQIIFIGIFGAIWYYFKFLNSCQDNIMKVYNKPFVGKKIGEDEKIPQTIVDYFQGKEDNSFNFFKEVNKGLSNWEKIYVIIFHTHIMNREIIILVLSLILNILFISTKIPIFLVVQILFILNIISTLFDIVRAIQLKWKNIVLLLLFNFLCIYVFTWFSFFYFSYFFIFDDVLIPKSQDTLTEGYCFSSVQCYLFMLNRGSLSNGGISNDLGKISYKRDISHFIGRYFYDVLFFLLISLYIGKMFLSFIIDTFGDLRKTNDKYNKDKNEVCFICQIDRNECLLKSIDFDKHVKNVHNLWNYVYFLNYLYVNNSLNFNWIENSVWVKLQEQGINWLPLYKKN